VQFQQIKSTDNIKDIVKSAFDLNLDISGLWGYDEHNATNILSIGDLTKQQLEFTLMSVRAHIQMNMTLDEEDRYAGINPSEVSRETLTINHKIYDKVVYKITAIKEIPYKKFMKEYKENYGKNNFDIQAHFEQRKKYSIQLTSIYWFDITKII
jgi:hypothetical protein